MQLADSQHFGTAAERLGLTQSAVSQRVRGLEAELGVTLFERTTRSVSTTPACARFLERVAPALHELDRARREAGSAGRGETGRLAIGLVGSARTPPVPRILRAYRRRYPAVDISVTEAPSERQIQGLTEGVLDVGFIRPPLAPRPGPEFELLTLARERLVAVLPDDHRLAARRRLAPRELASEPFVRTPRELGPGFYDQITSLCREAGFQPRAVQEAVQLSSIVGLVAAGFGVSILPESAAGHREPSVRFVALSPTATVELALAVPRPSSTRPTVKRFLEVVGELKSRSG